jgi:hypothetical protein
MATSCFRGRPPATKPGHGRARLETHCCQDVRRGVALRRCRPVRTMALPAAFVAPPQGSATEPAARGGKRGTARPRQGLAPGTYQLTEL